MLIALGNHMLACYMHTLMCIKVWILARPCQNPQPSVATENFPSWFIFCDKGQSYIDAYTCIRMTSLGVNAARIRLRHWTGYMKTLLLLSANGEDEAIWAHHSCAYTIPRDPSIHMLQRSVPAILDDKCTPNPWNNLACTSWLWDGSVKHIFYAEFYFSSRG